MKKKAVQIALPLLLLVAAPGVTAQSPEGLRASAEPTQIKLSSKSPAFSGRVSSPAGACEEGRRVELMRKSGGDVKRLGSDASGATGSWAVRLDNVKPGAYFARTNRKAKGNGGSRTVCAPGRSEVVVIG